MVFSNMLGNELQAENEVRYNYSSTNNVAAELLPGSYVVRKVEKTRIRQRQIKFQ